MLLCATALEEEMEAPTDRQLPYLIRLQHLAECVNEMYRMEKSDNRTEMGQVRLRAHVKTFKSQLEDWRTSLPSGIEQSRQILFHPNSGSTADSLQPSLCPPITPSTSASTKWVYCMASAAPDPLNPPALPLPLPSPPLSA